jgi:sugar lactone lactonase YvrE
MPPSSNSASLVIGSDRFDALYTGSAPNRLNTPLDVSIDSVGRIYVADTRNNRVLVFPSLIFLPISDASAVAVIGQADAGGSAVNWSSQDGAATADGFFNPAGLFVDRRDTLYVADSGNHRVLHFLKSARVLHAAYRQASTLARGALVNIEGEGLAQAEENSLPRTGRL